MLIRIYDKLSESPPQTAVLQMSMEQDEARSHRRLVDGDADDEYLFWDLEPFENDPLSDASDRSPALSDDSAVEDSENITSSVSKKRKSVRFADAHGHPLVSVRHFDLTAQDEDENQFFGDGYDSGEHSPISNVLQRIARSTRPLPGSKASQHPRVARRNRDSQEPNCVELLFPDPLSNYSKLVTEKLRLQNVALEGVHARGGYIKGLARVRNISSLKQVFVRMSFDQWSSFHDWKADVFRLLPLKHHSTQVAPPSDNEQYEFLIPIPPHLQPGTVIEFCICFRVEENGETTEYWDNNNQLNYHLRYCPRVTRRSSVTSSSDSSDSESEQNPFSTFVWSEFASWDAKNKRDLSRLKNNKHLVTPVFYRAPAPYYIEVPTYW